MSFLLIERGLQKGTKFSLNTFPVVIGRDVSCDVILEDNNVSRFQLRLRKRGKLYILDDLDSSNGTFLNGEKIKNAIVKNGDRIQVANIEMRFVAAELAIKLSDEVNQLNIQVDEKIISDDLFSDDDEKKELLVESKRINLSDDNILSHLSGSEIKKMHDIHSNVAVCPNLKDSAEIVLKQLNKIVPMSSRAVVFIWDDIHRMLHPIASKVYDKNNTRFRINHRSFEDVINRKKAIILNAKDEDPVKQKQMRIILPIIYQGKPNALLHIEVDKYKSKLTNHSLKYLQAILYNIAPSIEALILKKEVDLWMVGLIETLVSTIEAKDTYTQGHSERVSRHCMSIADELQLKRDVKKHLLVSALCHDIGKIAVPDAILKKTSMLSPEEYAEMKLHPTIGADIIQSVPNSKRIISGIKYHHEKWDGTGYPDGLVGEEIPFFGRIVAIADAFDAMVSGRSYSGFIDETLAIEKLNDEADLFDPDILQALTKSYEKGNLTLKTGTGSKKPDEEV